MPLVLHRLRLQLPHVGLRNADDGLVGVENFVVVDSSAHERTSGK